MPIAPLIEELGLKRALEKLDKASTQEVPAGLRTLPARLVKSIKVGTVTVEEIDSLLGKAPQISLEQRAYLLSKKAWLLRCQDRVEEGLQCYDEALNTKETPSTWALKGTALLEMDRLDEAFQAFQQAYLLRENFGPQKQGYLKDLFGAWSTAALLRSLFGILGQDLREAQKGVDEYLAVLDKARGESLEGAVVAPIGIGVAAKEPISQEHREAVEELELMVRLLSIKDPFERWRAFTKEISKVWPEGVSAVDAIREQRDREWNK
jgi:tetratricopeptide (TPR) repeat protein